MTITIYCTDGSEIATNAAKVGRDILRPADRVVVATVVDVPDETMVQGASGFAGGTMSERAFDAATADAIRDGHRIVDELVELLGVQGVETSVLTGDPRDSLCRLAEELAATTVVVGSRGRGPIKKAVLGSVSDHLVRHAHCPVLVVGP